MNPTVTVIMNCLNGRMYLAEALTTVIAQTYEDWEVVFWDNGSTDGSADLVQGFGDERIRVFHTEDTVPLGEARNRALEQARGAYLAFLDCDDLWAPDKLARQVAVLDAEPGTGLVFTDFLNQTDSGSAYPRYGDRRPPSGMVFRQLLQDYFLGLSTVMVRREALQALDGLFDHRLEVMEETDVFLRLSLDWVCTYVPGALATYRIHEGGWSVARRDRQALEAELILEKLRARRPDLEAAYPLEIAQLRADSALKSVLGDWEAGRRAEARRKLRPHAGQSLRYRLIYALTYLPYPVYPFIARLRHLWRTRTS